MTLALAPIDPGAKLDCVSYAPFRTGQTPWNSTDIISAEQIAEDLADLAKVSRCVRTYSTENGLDKVPELASRVGLKVILGIWLGRDHIKNALLIDTAVAVAEQHKATVTSLMVGSEVLLRGEMLASDLRKTIRAVRARTQIPVSYADVWEDLPARAEDAVVHVDDIRKRLVQAFPEKEILIGETGWPSRGRMRDGALPSRINQARFISGIIERARQQNFRINLFEAYDEPWKRQWEGTVGSSWGLFDGETRALKYPPGTAIGNYPFWKLQLGSGLVFGIFVFGAAFWTLRRRPSPPRFAAWVAVALSATAGGILLGLTAEQLLNESYGLGDWLMRSLLLASGIAAPLLCSSAVMSEPTLPTFWELMHQHESRTLSLPALALGLTLIVTTLIATENALAFVFDPRWRDFQFAGLTMVAVPFATLTLLRRPASGPRPIAEAVFASLFAATTIYATCNEGFNNWQSVWTSAAYLMFVATLWQPRSVAAAKTATARRIVFSGVVPSDGKAVAREPAAVTVNPEPALHAGAMVRIRGDGPRAGSDFGS